MERKNTLLNIINLGCLVILLIGNTNCGETVSVKTISVDTISRDSIKLFDSQEWKDFKAIFGSDEETQTAVPYLQAAKSSKLLKVDSIELFTKINGIDLSPYNDLIKHNKWDLALDSINNLMLSFDTLKTIKDKNYKVFGWHPFWMKEAYKNYNYEVLSHVSWFSYDIEASTGSYSNQEVIQDLRQNGKELIELAQAKECKVLLTLTNHGYNKNKVFLADRSNQQEVLIDSVLMLLQTLGLDGIDVNFELVNQRDGSELMDFLERLGVRLKSASQNYTYCVTIPKVNRNRYPNIKKLNPYVDYYLLTGYDFHTGGSSRDGPIAPLYAKGKKLSIDSIVTDYLIAGIKKDQLILGLPYYGGRWESNSPNIRSKDKSFTGHLTYRNIMAKYGNRDLFQYDSISQSVYLMRSIGNQRFEKIWFDDAKTLATKFNWAKETQLAGVGIWALGYDNGRQELWEALDQTMAVNSKEHKNIYLETNLLFKIAAIMVHHETSLFLMIVFFCFFGGLGFLIAIFDWRVRDYLFNSNESRLMTTLISIGLVLFIYAITFSARSDKFIEEMSTFLIGMLVGVLITSLVYWWGFKRNKYLS